MTRRPAHNSNIASLLVLLLFLIIGLFSDASSLAQVAPPFPVTKHVFLDTVVAEFELHDQTLVDAVWKLARSPASFAFGFESPLKARLSDPDPNVPILNVSFKNKSVREILDLLCEADQRFTWSADGNTVNIYPRNTVGVSSYLLNRKLANFELRNATDVQDGLLAIVHQLPPPTEQIANAQVGGDDPYPKQPWNVKYNGLTVRQIVNRLALRGGPCGAWIFGGSNNFRAFGFFNTNLQCAEPLTDVSSIFQKRNSVAKALLPRNSVE